MDLNVDIPHAKRGRFLKTGDRLVTGYVGTRPITQTVLATRFNAVGGAFGCPPSRIVSFGLYTDCLVADNEIVEVLD